MAKILIVDGCAEFRQTLTDQLKYRYSIRSCCDGTQALSALEDFCPDLLVVDLMLQGTDGLGVLKAAQKLANCPPALVTAHMYPSYAINLMEQLNVAYAMLKPCDMHVLTERIDDLMETETTPVIITPTPHGAVTAALLELGLNPGRSGFQYCRDAILMLQEEPYLRVTKDIYPAIAKEYHTGATAVEKNIRDTIAAAWRNTDPAILGKYFAPAANGQIPRPSNHVFLSTLTERLFSLQQNAI